MPTCTAALWWLYFDVVADDPDRGDVLRFALSVPAGPVPATGFPICIYQHGTTGDWMTFFQEGNADRITAQGIAIMFTSGKVIRKKKERP